MSEPLKNKAPQAEAKVQPELVERPDDPLAEIHQSDTTNNLCGQIVGDHYEILSLLGTGGLGAVYKAHHKLLDKIVAIKFLLKGKNISPKALVRFQREAQAAIGLTHPNIAGVQEFGIYNEMPYIVMEFVEGESLADIIEREAPIEPLRALKILKQALHGLAYAHKKNIIHRDMKPGNIVIRKNERGEEQVKIIDFGIAKIVEEESSVDLTKTGEIFGTPNYMSPEQCRGLKTAFGTDLYSLGCVAYEMLSGFPPFQGKASIEVILKHVNEMPKVLPAQRGAPGLEKVIDRSLAKDPKNRYSSANEMLSDLTLIETGMKPRKAFYLKTKTLRQAIVFFVFTILAVLIAGLSIVYLYGEPDTIGSLSQKIRFNPVDPAAYFMRADAYMKAKNYPGAVSDLTQAIGLNPRVARYYSLRSFCQCEAGQYDKALADAEKAIDLDWNDYQGYVHRARAEYQLGYLDLCLKDCQLALERNPENDANYNFPVFDLRADIHIRKHEYTEALADANKAIELCPKPGGAGSYSAELMCNAYSRRADANLGLKRFKDALSDAEKALKHDPKSFVALDRKASALCSLRRFDESLAFINEALEISPNTDYLHEHKQRILRYQAKYQGKASE